MSTDTDILALYREFSDALTEVLAENAVGPARRGRLARARAAVKKHPEKWCLRNRPIPRLKLVGLLQCRRMAWNFARGDVSGHKLNNRIDWHAGRGKTTYSHMCGRIAEQREIIQELIQNDQDGVGRIDAPRLAG